ncbi:T9SS type A sorting domain-containing protein [bacterium]|nr:T9SS type A sorting domain-containing protein [bacterium]
MYKCKKIIIICTTFLIWLNLHATCTIGVATGEATSDGRPVIFKNRDITSWSLEFKVVNTSGYFSYACNTSYGSTTPWLGVNEAGFGMVQSAAYNISSSGGGGLGNGTLMSYALKRCITVDDLQAILDSTDISGRATAACYAVIDAYGGAAVFECANWNHARYEPDSIGLITRANFAYIGGSGRTGENRMERAYELMRTALLGDSLDAEFIAKYVVSDLLLLDQDPYPLPFTGSFPGMPAGWVDCGPFTGLQTVCNGNSHASGVIQGVAAGSPPDNAVLWCFFGVPVVSVPFPVFPASHSEPPEATGYSPDMLEAAHAKTDSAFSHPSEDDWLNTAFLLNNSGAGVWTYSRPTLDWAFDTVNLILANWELELPTATERESFQDLVMDRIMDAYTTGIPAEVAEAALPIELNINAYPNPFNSRVSIIKPHDAKAAIYDLSGRIVWKTDQGVTEVAWQPKAELSNGIYLLKVYNNHQEISINLVYIK